MAVRLDSPSILANDALIAGLRVFGVSSDGAAAGRLWQAEQVAIPRPVPLYTSSFQAAVTGLLLQEAVQTGWLYFVLEGGRTVAHAEVAPSLSGDGYTLVSLAHSTFSDASGAALSLAVQIADQLPEELDLRMLRVPSLHLMAVWIHGDGVDRVFPLPPAPFGLKPFVGLEGDALTRILQEKGESQLGQSNEP